MPALRRAKRPACRPGRACRGMAWSSLTCWQNPEQRPAYWHEGPVKPRRFVVGIGQCPATEAESAELRLSVNRGRPMGHAAWQQTIAKQLGVEASLRPPRPTEEGRQNERRKNLNVPFSPSLQGIRADGTTTAVKPNPTSSVFIRFSPKDGLTRRLSLSHNRSPICLRCKFSIMRQSIEECIEESW